MNDVRKWMMLLVLFGSQALGCRATAIRDSSTPTSDDELRSRDDVAAEDEESQERVPAELSPSEVAPTPPASDLTAGPRSYQRQGDGTCGDALPNPHGLNNSPERDGSCKVCEHEPQSIPSCSANKPAMSLTHENLKLHVGRVVSFKGQFGYMNRLCTLMGGPCHCTNVCGARLQLFAPGVLRPPLSTEEAQRIRSLPYEEAAPIYDAEQERITSAAAVDVGLASLSAQDLAQRSPDAWPYVDRGGTLHGGGDEGSLCSPFRFEHYEQWSDVIMTGVLSHESQYPEEGWDKVYRLRMTSVCRR